MKQVNALHIKKIMKNPYPLHLIMKLSQRLLKGLCNCIMGFIFKRIQIEIFGGVYK